MKYLRSIKEHLDLGLPYRYWDIYGERYGQEYTLSLFDNLDDYTDITTAFKRGMKKQAELLRHDIEASVFKAEECAEVYVLTEYGDLEGNEDIIDAFKSGMLKQLHLK